MHLKIVTDGQVRWISNVDETELDDDDCVEYLKDGNRVFIDNPDEAYLINSQGETIDVLVRAKRVA